MYYVVLLHCSCVTGCGFVGLTVTLQTSQCAVLNVDINICCTQCYHDNASHWLSETMQLWWHQH